MARWRVLQWTGLGFGAAALIVAACSGDDDVFRAELTGSYDASTADRALPPLPAVEASTPTPLCGDAGGAPQRVLVMNGNRPSEVAAVNLDTGMIDGRFDLDGGTGVTSAALNVDPWLLDEDNDLVMRLDAREPWKVLGTWDLRSNDALTNTPATPVAVAQVSCTKAYVARFERNRIAIIDPSSSAGVPTGFIDLSSLALPGDTGAIDVTSAVWVPTKKRVFVLAGNVDRTQTAAGGALLCTNLKPSVFAIDPATDAIVSLGGHGTGGSLQLQGIDPPVGSPMVYDPAFDRLLIASGGCAALGPDGGLATARRFIEQVDLATGAVSTLLDLTDHPRPTGIAFVDAEHAVVAFGRSGAFAWDPLDGGVIRQIPSGLDRVSDDGRGGFIGAQQRQLVDAGFTVDVVLLPADGGETVIATEPFAVPATNAASLEPWPHR